MATGATVIYDLPYPLISDPVNVHEDIQSLAEQVELVISGVGVPFISYEVTNNSGETISKGDPVYITGYSGTTTKTTVARSDSDDENTFPVLGLAQSEISNNTDGVIVIAGVFDNVDTSSFTAGDKLYVNSGGGLTNSGSGAIGTVAKASNNGIIILLKPKGNGTWGALKEGMA
jgi:hypothetical protein